MYVSPVEPSQPEMGAGDITAQCEDPIKISLIDEKVSFLKFWVQNPIQEHVLHLIVLSPQGSSVCNSGSVSPPPPIFGHPKEASGPSCSG